MTQIFLYARKIKSSYTKIKEDMSTAKTTLQALKDKSYTTISLRDFQALLNKFVLTGQITKADSILWLDDYNRVTSKTTTSTKTVYVVEDKPIVDESIVKPSSTPQEIIETTSGVQLFIDSIRANNFAGFTYESLSILVKGWIVDGAITTEAGIALLDEFQSISKTPVLTDPNGAESPTNEELILSLSILQPMIQTMVDAQNADLVLNSQGGIDPSFASSLYDALNLAESATNEALLTGTINPRLAGKMAFALQSLADKIASKTGVEQDTATQKEQIAAIASITVLAVLFTSFAMWQSSATRDTVVALLQAVTYSLLFLAVSMGVIVAGYWLISSLVENSFDVGETLGSMIGDLFKGIFDAIGDVLVSIATAFAGEAEELFVEARDSLAGWIDGLMNGGQSDPNRPNIRELELSIVLKLHSRGLTQYNVVPSSGQPTSGTGGAPLPPTQQQTTAKFVFA